MMKIGTISFAKQLLLFAFLCFLAGCGDALNFSFEEKLIIAMIGAFEAPEGAEGNGEPRSMGFTLEGVALIGEDGTETEMYEDPPAVFAIVNRSQIIAEADVSKYVGVSFSGIRVSFASDASVVGKINGNLVVTLNQPDLLHAEIFTIEKAKELRLNIKTQWKNILTVNTEEKTESAIAPSFVLGIKYD